VALTVGSGEPTWRVHAAVTRTRANGPGLRYGIWVQGCSLGCPGCFNPATHPGAGHGSVVPVRRSVAAVLAEPAIEGVTLTGGEPLEQPAATALFCAQVRAAGGLGIIVLTGFTRAEIEADPARLAAVAAADLVLAGRYNRHRHLGTGLRGSANKVAWPITARYSLADLDPVPALEVLLGPEGTVTVTGMTAAADRIGVGR
jgi:anaerobic ribonucleoside-triphosphate reductase activating protein